MTINKNKAKLPPVSDGTAAAPAPAAVAVPDDDVIDPGTCFTLGPKRRSIWSRNTTENNMYQTPSGDFITMDADRQRLIDSGKQIISGQDFEPDGSGGFRTVSNDELRHDTQEAIRERRMLSDRFGFGNDPYSNPSGLSVRGRSRSDDDDNNNSSSNGLSV